MLQETLKGLGLVLGFNCLMLPFPDKTSKIQLLSSGKFSLFPIGEIARHRLGIRGSSKVGGIKTAL